MVNLLDLKWLVQCQKQLMDLADDPDYAALIKETLDKDPELREDLARVYARALRTIELDR